MCYIHLHAWAELIQALADAECCADAAFDEHVAARLNDLGVDETMSDEDISAALMAGVPDDEE